MMKSNLLPKIYSRERAYGVRRRASDDQGRRSAIGTSICLLLYWITDHSPLLLLLFWWLMLGFMLLTPLFSRSLYSFNLCYQLSWCIDVFCSRTKANSDVIFLI